MDDPNDWKLLPSWQRTAIAILILFEVCVLFFGLPIRPFPAFLPPRIALYAAGIIAIPLIIIGLVMIEGVDRIGRRRRAGQCIWCGYDLQASPTRCPECGRPREPS